VNFSKELFHLLEKNGLIDFRDFVRLIGILKSDNLEDKLRLYFKTYDLDNNGFLDKVSFKNYHFSFKIKNFYEKISIKKFQEKNFNVKFSIKNFNKKISMKNFNEKISMKKM